MVADCYILELVVDYNILKLVVNRYIFELVVNRNILELVVNYNVLELVVHFKMLKFLIAHCSFNSNFFFFFKFLKIFFWICSNFSTFMRKCQNHLKLFKYLVNLKILAKSSTKFKTLHQV